MSAGSVMHVVGVRVREPDNAAGVHDVGGSDGQRVLTGR
jgi:hypothetical protein